MLPVENYADTQRVLLNSNSKIQNTIDKSSTCAQWLGGGKPQTYWDRFLSRNTYLKFDILKIYEGM